MWIPKGYHPFKLISPVQQQTEMAEMLVKRKRGIGKTGAEKRNRKTNGKKKKGIRKMVKKKKTSNNYVTKKSGSKNTSVRRVKKSTRGRRMVRKDIFSYWSTIRQFRRRFY